jgi:ribose 5-phosphate isomerase A
MDRLKKMAAVSAVKEVQDGQIVGLGTGSTARFAIIELGRRIREEELDILGVPTSIATEELARKSGIPLTTLQEHEVIDIDIDGADQVDQHLNMIKGGGGAHTREKLVALSSKKLIIIVDESKLTDELNIPVPVEVLPFAWRPVAKRLEGLGCSPALRTTSGAPFVTDNKNFIVDCDFGIIKNPQKLEREINTITGVIENGIFAGMACEVHVGSDKGVRILK